jgi:hypothetical protein
MFTQAKSVQHIYYPATTTPQLLHRNYYPRNYYTATTTPATTTPLLLPRNYYTTATTPNYYPRHYYTATTTPQLLHHTVGLIKILRLSTLVKIKSQK